MLKAWADKMKWPIPIAQRNCMSCPRSWWESVAKEAVSWGKEALIQGLTHKTKHLWTQKREDLQQFKACCAGSTSVCRALTKCRPVWNIIPYLRPSHPSSHRHKCLWRKPGVPHPHTPPHHSHSRCESRPLQSCRHRNKWARQNEKAKRTLPFLENLLLTLQRRQVLHREREEDKSRSQHPPTSFPQAVGRRTGNFD